ncbi:hypothetical protein H0H81_003981, partial [Sphagnurus paluster]
DGPTQMQQLEQQIAELQYRIKTLESPEEMPGVALYNPYAVVNTPGSSESPSGSRSTIPTDVPSMFPEDCANNPTQSHATYEPPIYEKNTILHAFFNTTCYAATKIGFFLDPKHTVDVMLLELFEDPDYPTPALTYAIYLWGYHFSPSSSTASHREQSLKRAKYFLSEDLTGPHPHKVLHTIQAEVLLAHYYLSMGNVQESSRHAGGALGLALGAGLHRSTGDGTAASSYTVVTSPGFISRRMLSSTSSLGKSGDNIDRSQYIDAFWAVYTINVYLTVIQGLGAMYSLDSHTVDVPWPIEKQGSGPLPHQKDLGMSYYATILEFLDGKSNTGLSEKALHAKAVVLLEKSVAIHAEGELTTDLNTEFLRLDTLIMEFGRALPSITPSQASRSSVYLHVTTNMLVYAALIKLHSPFVSSLAPGRLGPALQQCFRATQVIADLTRTHLVYGSESSAIVADPIIGLSWTAVYQFFLLLAGSHFATDIKNDCSLAAFEAFDTILDALNVYSDEVPLLKLLLMRGSAAG